MKKLWGDSAWEDYSALSTSDRAYLKKVNTMIKEIDRNGLANAGALKDNLSGFYSKHITKKDRIVFRITEDANQEEILEIVAIKGHYFDK